VIHNRIGHWIPNSVGSSAKRFYKIEDDLLTLTPDGNENYRLVYRRIKQ